MGLPKRARRSTAQLLLAFDQRVAAHSLHQRLARAIGCELPERAVPYRNPDDKRAFQRRWKKDRDTGAAELTGEKKVLFTMRIPESLAARIHRTAMEAIATGRFPWKTPSEVGRALLYRGFETLKDDTLVQEWLPYFSLVQQLDTIGGARKEAFAALSKAREEIGALLEIKADTQAAQYYHTALRAAKKMAPTVWRDHLIEELQAAFPQLDKVKAKGITLETKPSRRHHSR